MAINRQDHGRRNGRPRRPGEEPSDAQLDVFLRTYAEDLSLYEARHAAGINRAQLARALDRRPDFAARVREIALEDADDRLEGAALRMAVRGDREMLKFLLVARKPEMYGPRASVNLNVDVTALSEDELRSIVDRHGRRGDGDVRVGTPGGPG